MWGWILVKSAPKLAKSPGLEAGLWTPGLEAGPWGWVGGDEGTGGGGEGKGEGAGGGRGEWGHDPYEEATKSAWNKRGSPSLEL